MSRLRIGFIGAGGIAGRHFRNLLQFDDVQIAAIADPLVYRAQELAERANASAYADAAEMLDRENLDALYICIPPFAHGPPEQQAVERRIPFFVEKPVAADWKTAQHIATRVEAAGIVTAVGYHWRYLDIAEQVRELLRDNPARLAIGYWLDQTPPPAWWVKQAESGGQMVEQTTHIVDLMRLLVGEVTGVFGVGARTVRPQFPDADVCDVSTATFRFADGAVGSISSTCLLRWAHRIGLHLFANELAIELTEFDLIVDVGRGRPVRQAQGDPFVREDRDFIDAVERKTNRIRSPYAEALRTHRVTTAIAQSAHEQRPVLLQTEAVHG
jgi:predicted dehydrogenase